MIASSRSYAIGMAHFWMAGGWKALGVICGVYLLLFGAGISLYYYIDISTGARAGLSSLAVTFLFAIEAVVLVVFGSARVAGAIRRDISSRMIESHRLMPIPNWRAVVGYLLGGSLHAVVFALFNVVLAYIIGGVTGTSLMQITMNQAVLFAFAALVWSFSALTTFQFRYVYFIGVALLVLGACSGLVFYAYFMLPGLALLISPLFDRTIFIFSGTAPRFMWSQAAAFGAQALFFAVFFSGACRRYRGTFATTFNVPQAFVLLLTWSVASAVGLGLWDEFSAGRGFFGPGGSGEDVIFRHAQAIASLAAAMTLALIPLSTIAVERRDKRMPAIFVPFLLALAAVAVAMVVLGVYPWEGDYHFAPLVTLLVAGAHVLTVYGLFRLTRRMQPIIAWLIVGGGLALLWLGPLVLELARVLVAGVESEQNGFGALGTMSPLGLLISAWTGRPPYPPVWGLIVQWVVAGVVAASTLLLKDKRATAPLVASAPPQAPIALAAHRQDADATAAAPTPITVIPPADSST
jgi:hypothetical protein